MPAGMPNLTGYSGILFLNKTMNSTCIFGKKVLFSNRWCAAGIFSAALPLVIPLTKTNRKNVEKSLSYRDGRSGRRSRLGS